MKKQKTTISMFLKEHIDQKINLGMLKELWYEAYYSGYTDKLYKKNFQPFKREGNDENSTKG